MMQADKNDPEFVFYDVTKSTVHIYRYVIRFWIDSSISGIIESQKKEYVIDVKCQNEKSCEDRKNMTKSIFTL